MDAQPASRRAHSHRPALIDRPIVIVGCNRSGTTLLFNTLSAHPETWSLYVEAQRTFHRHFPVDPTLGERVAEPATPEIRSAIVRELFGLAHSKEYFQQYPVLRSLPTKLFQRPLGRFYKSAPLRLVEKTPANSLRIPLIASLFPDARFIYLVRRGEDVVSSLMEGWKRWSGSQQAPWHYSGWHYLVPPGWRNWIDRTLQEICAFQWIESNRFAMADLQALPPERRLLVRHEELIEDSRSVYRRILSFCELEPSPAFDRVVASLPQRAFTTGGSPPRKGKWRQLHRAEIESVHDLIGPMNRQLYSDSRPSPRRTDWPPIAPDARAVRALGPAR